MQRARAFHAVTAAVTIFAIVFQLVLVCQGGRVLDETGEPDPLGERLWHFFSYFTVQSNILVALATALLAQDAARDGRGFRAVRLASMLGITITGIVHFFLLRPLLNLNGADYLADKLLHIVVPALALLGWALFGPRPRIDRKALVPALVWPIGYLVYCLIVGAVDGWYPYPFLDPDEDGWGAVVVTAIGITALFVAFYFGGRLVDRKAKVAP